MCFNRLLFPKEYSYVFAYALSFFFFFLNARSPTYRFEIPMTQTKFWQKWLLLYFFFSVTLCPQRLCGLFRMGSPGPTPTLTFTQPPSSDSLLYVYSVDTSTSLERKMDALAKSSYICQQTDVGSSLLQLTFLFRSCLWTPSCDFAPENWINEMLKRLTLPPTRMQNQSGGDSVALSVGYPPPPPPPPLPPHPSLEATQC